MPAAINEDIIIQLHVSQSTPTRWSMKSKSSTHSLFLLAVHSIWPHSLCMVPTAGMWVCVLGSRPETQLHLYQMALNYLSLSTPTSFQFMLQFTVSNKVFNGTFDGKVLKLELLHVCLTHSKFTLCMAWLSHGVMVCTMLECTHEDSASSVLYSTDTTGRLVTDILSHISTFLLFSPWAPLPWRWHCLPSGLDLVPQSISGNLSTTELHPQHNIKANFTGLLEVLCPVPFSFLHQLYFVLCIRLYFSMYAHMHVWRIKDNFYESAFSIYM